MNTKDNVGAPNRKIEQTIEKEKETRAKLRGNPQTEEPFDSRLKPQ